MVIEDNKFNDFIKLIYDPNRFISLYHKSLIDNIKKDKREKELFNKVCEEAFINNNIEKLNKIYEILFDKELGPEEKRILIYKNLPVDMYKKYLVKKFYFDEKRVYSFENELQEVIDKCENSLILKNQINYFLHNEKNNFKNIFIGIKNRCNDPYPSDSLIRSKYDYLNHIEDKEKRNEIIGHYGELKDYELYNNLIKEKVIEENARIHWVARNIGDGFGYDLLLCVDDDLEIRDEVKTTDTRNKKNDWYDNLSLTKTEYEEMNEIKQKSIYQIDRVFLGKDNKVDYELLNLDKDGNLISSNSKYVLTKVKDNNYTYTREKKIIYKI